VGAASAGARSDVRRPPLTFVRGEGSFTEAARSPKSHTITMIVIHATDGGSLLGNVWWLSGGHSHASAHYVISRDGEIIQLVHLSDIAWHAGNWKMNCHSIGIEHVGDTYDPNGFTTDQYKSSARLVATPPHVAHHRGAAAPPRAQCSRLGDGASAPKAWTSWATLLHCSGVRTLRTSSRS